MKKIGKARMVKNPKGKQIGTARPANRQAPTRSYGTRLALIRGKKV